MNYPNLLYPICVVSIILLTIFMLPSIMAEQEHNHTVEPVEIEDHPKLHTTIILCGDSMQVQKDTQKHIPYDTTSQ